MMKKMNKKAFTLIELLVVIAVIGILVLLGAPRFAGYTQKAEDARIQHDIKVMEQEVGTMLINGDDDFNKWGNNIKDLNQLAQDNELFEKEGHVDKDGDPIDGTHKVIPGEYRDKINTKLKGTFYANRHGKVYYEHGNGLEYSDEELDDLIKNHDFIPVATAEELNNVRSATLETYGKGTKWEDKYTGGLDEKYVQVANIDLSGFSEGAGWEPVGTSSGNNSSTRFRGTYDGNGHKITRLTINRPSQDYVGLFGYTEGATIENVALGDINVTGRDRVGGLVSLALNSTIRNSYATGSVEGRDYVGGLVGMASANTTISNSYATGSVEGRDRVGGLVGEAYSINISNSYSTGEVTGTEVYIGGLVGYANVSTNITDSYAMGPVTGKDQVGGLVGYARSSIVISNSYATGSVTGTRFIGGLVGHADKSNISNSYATGLVTGTGQVGGLVGYANNNSTTSNAYWNKETTKQTKSAGQDDSFGKTTDEMKKQTTYTDWNFDTVWEITTGNYPTLR